MKIFWIGSPFFSTDLRTCGFEVICHNFENLTVYHWEDIVKLCDGEPSVVVVADKSRPPFVLGQENFPCLTVFYAVDTHIHSYLPYYAQSFDLCLVSLREHIPKFLHKFLEPEQVHWFYPFAKHIEPAQFEKKYKCLFVGTIDPKTTPKRKRILDELQNILPFMCVTRGNYTQLYPQAEIVLNISELGDLNFRVFEALACNSCLLTQNIGQGQAELFTPGHDLFVYDNLNAQEIASKINYLLENPELRHSLAQNGFEKIQAFHTSQKRAEQFAELIKNTSPKLKDKRLLHAKKIKETYLRMPYLLFAEQILALKKDYLLAAK